MLTFAYLARTYLQPGSKVEKATGIPATTRSPLPVMDPFSALSIATAVVQFVEFGTKLGQRMLVMYDANRLDPLDSFEVITKDLDDYAKEMLGHLRPMQKGREDAAVNANAEVRIPTCRSS